MTSSELLDTIDKKISDPRYRYSFQAITLTEVLSVLNSGLKIEVCYDEPEFTKIFFQKDGKNFMIYKNTPYELSPKDISTILVYSTNYKFFV